VKFVLMQENILDSLKHTEDLDLIRHLKNGRWKNSSKDDFARSPDDGHYDAIDALIYLIKSISYSKNPYPKNYNINSSTIYYPPAAYEEAKKSTVDVYKSIFGRKSKLK